jgi:hypothetical protein
MNSSSPSVSVAMRASRPAEWCATMRPAADALHAGVASLFVLRIGSRM